MNGPQWTLTTISDAQTRALGARLGRLLARGDVIALSGDLGAGKTTFVQGLARGLGITAPITSPTFILVNRYRTPAGHQLQHADCYRLKDAPLEMWDLGLEDLLAGDDIVVIEWADRIPGLLPADYLDITFEYVDEARRRLAFRGHGTRWETLVRELAENEVLAETRFLEGHDAARD